MTYDKLHFIILVGVMACTMTWGYGMNNDWGFQMSCLVCGWVGQQVAACPSASSQKFEAALLILSFGL